MSGSGLLYYPRIRFQHHVASRHCQNDVQSDQSDPDPTSAAYRRKGKGKEKTGKNRTHPSFVLASHSRILAFSRPRVLVHSLVHRFVDLIGMLRTVEGRWGCEGKFHFHKSVYTCISHSRNANEGEPFSSSLKMAGNGAWTRNGGLGTRDWDWDCVSARLAEGIGPQLIPCPACLPMGIFVVDAGCVDVCRCDRPLVTGRGIPG